MVVIVIGSVRNKFLVNGLFCFGGCSCDYILGLGLKINCNNWNVSSLVDLKFKFFNV